MHQLPEKIAKYSGVRPLSSSAFTFAPCLINHFETSSLSLEKIVGFVLNKTIIIVVKKRQFKAIPATEAAKCNGVAPSFAA